MTVDNSCSCTHHRSKHTLAENGEEKVRGKCEVEKCTCISYTQMYSKITPVQYKYLLIGTLTFITIILACAIGISMVNGSVDDSNDSYYKIWKGDVDNFDQNFASYYNNNGTLSDVKDYLEKNAQEFKDSKNASGVVVPTMIGLLVVMVVIIIAYDRERKEEKLE